MKLTYYGHACFGLETKEHHLLFDPFISDNPLAKDIDVNAIPADFILVSHAHGDHIGDAVSIAKRTGAQVISNYEIINWFASQGIEGGHPMNHGGAWTFPWGKLHMVNAVHTSSFPDGTYGGNPAGFVLEVEGKNIYFSGDTALTYDMKLIGEKWKIDWAILCIGDNFTMGYRDAVKASDFVKCDKVIGMHFDTFGYIKIDHGSAKAAFNINEKSLALMKIGASMDL